MKKRITLLLAALILLLTISGCSKDKEPLRLGSMPTYSAAIYAVGIEKGFFQDAGVEVELTIFRSARDRDAAATAGELNGFMTDIMGAINLNAKGFPVKMTSSEYEDFGLMASANVDIEAIELPKTGISENTVTEFIVDTYVNKKVEKVNILAVPDRMGALLSSELDFGVFPQPFMGIIKGKGGQLVLSTATENFHPVVLVFEDDYLIDNRSSVKAFYEGYMKTVEYMKETSYEEYKDILVTYTLATPETVDLYRLPVDQFKLSDVDEVSYDKIVLWMLDKKLLDTKLTFESVHSSEFIN